MKRVGIILRSVVLLAILVSTVSGCDTSQGLSNIKAVKNQVDLQSNIDNPIKHNNKKVILDQKWGTGEDDLKLCVDEGDSGIYYITPASYAVDNDQTIYIYDHLDRAVKVYKDNQLQNSFCFLKPDAKPPGTSVNPPNPSFQVAEKIYDAASFLPGINSSTVLHDMCVTPSGIIYATSRYSDQFLRIDLAKQEISPAVGPDQEVKKPESVSLLPSGNIMLCDNDDLQNATRVRKFNPEGELIFENASPNIIDFTLYDYETQDGDIIHISAFSKRNYQFMLNEEYANYSLDYPEPDKYLLGGQLLGADWEGNVYILIEKIKLDGNFVDRSKSELFIDKISIKDNEILTMKIDLFNPEMLSSAANECGQMVKIDAQGNVYQVQLSMDAYRIVQYSF